MLTGENVSTAWVCKRFNVVGTQKVSTSWVFDTFPAKVQRFRRSGCGKRFDVMGFLQFHSCIFQTPKTFRRLGFLEKVSTVWVLLKPTTSKRFAETHDVETILQIPMMSKRLCLRLTSGNDNFVSKSRSLQGKHFAIYSHDVETFRYLYRRNVWKTFHRYGCHYRTHKPQHDQKGFDGLGFTDTRDVETFSGKSFRPSGNP